MSERALAEAEQVLREWERERDLSGGVLLTRGGETLLRGRLRPRRSREPTARHTGTPASRWPRSRKMFTAVAVVDQVASGRLAFDTPVVDVLPEGRRPSTLLPEVTVHHLLCHTSGIADYYEEEPLDGSEEVDYADLWSDLPTYSIERPADYLATLRRPAAVLAAGREVLVLQRGLHRARAGARGGHRQAYHRGGAGAGLRPRRAWTRSGFFRLDEVLPDLARRLPAAGPDGEWRTNYFSVPGDRRRRRRIA